MKKEDVKFYYDPDGFLEQEATYPCDTQCDASHNCVVKVQRQATYPCDTQFMVYNPMLHRYFLTVEALQYYGLDAERKYISDSQDKSRELIEKTSKKVYDYINYKAGFSRYQIMMYRIATAPKTIYPDQYFMRKQFEQALVDQARFLIENGDSARVGRYTAESEMPQAPFKPDDTIKDFTDMSAECMRTLDTLNLTRWFAAGRNINPDLSKY